MEYDENGVSIVPLEFKKEIFEEARKDFRYEEYVRGCLNCGVCTGGCPPHRFFDFSPRIVLQNMKSKDPELIWTMMDEYVWACFQCFTCAMICPFLNNPGGVIAILREIAVRRGFESAKKVLKPYSRVLLKLTAYGNQLSPDMIQPDFFPDWGPHIGYASTDLAAKRKAIPMPTLQVTNLAWDVAPETMKELYDIFDEAGVFKIIEAVDPSLYEIIQDIVDDVRSS